MLLLSESQEAGGGYFRILVLVLILLGAGAGSLEGLEGFSDVISGISWSSLKEWGSSSQNLFLLFSSLL